MVKQTGGSTKPVQPDGRQSLDRNVYLMGLTSLLTDISSEMIYPLLQAFVSMILASRAALIGPVLGLIEGLAESTASLSKVFVGYYSDRIRKRKILAVTGYSVSGLSKLLLFTATLGWYFILLARFLDRIGKGIRTAPRDALIAESTPPGMQGRAYGLHRAMDFAGAFLGVLICYLVSLRFIDPVTRNLTDLRAFYILFGISLVPALAGVAVLCLVREKRSDLPGTRPRPNLDLRRYSRPLQMFFLSQLLFALGNSSNQFLLLRSMSLGHALSVVILMYMVFNLVSSLLSTWFGGLSDRWGRKPVLAAGYLVYACLYIGFGFIPTDHPLLLWAFWIGYGCYYAMTEGVEKAMVSRLAGSESKATALGFYHTIVGVSLLPASLIAGVLYPLHTGAPFIFGGGMALLATLVIGMGVSEPAS